MSSQPHTVLPWVIRRTRLPLLSLRCADCRSELDGAWRLDTPSAWLDEARPVQVEVVFEDPVPVRPERLIAQGLGLSRNEVLRRISCAVRRAPDSPLP